MNFSPNHLSAPVSKGSGSNRHHQLPNTEFLSSLQGRGAKLPIYLVGACERHNFGDMLMPHVVQQLIQNSEASSCVGLVDADLREDGGHRVISCETAFRTQKTAPTVIHFGGATLGCDLAYGYAMTTTGDERDQMVRMMQDDPMVARKFAGEQTGFKGHTAYVVDAKARWKNAHSAFHAVGLSEPETLDEVRKLELLRVLGAADFLGIRDSNGADFLEKEGLNVERMPCGVTMLPRVCRSVWSNNMTATAMEAVKERFPNGWISVQVSGYRKKAFKPLIKSIAEKCARMNLGVVFFAAGTAPGHDDVVELAKRANSFPGGGAMFFPSRNIWDISSLISESQMYIGTSLHGRIVAMSAGIPRINLAVNFAKIKSYCRLWEHPAVPFELTAEQLGDHFENLIEMDRGMLQAHSAWLEESYLKSFAKMCKATGLKQADLVKFAEESHGGALQKSRGLMAEWTGDSRTLKMLKRISRRRKKRREGLRPKKAGSTGAAIKASPLSRQSH